MLSPTKKALDRSPAEISGRAKFEAFVVGTIVVATLYLAREVFIPIAVAVLASFALAPLVDLLRRSGIGRVPAVIVTVLTAFCVLAGLAFFVANQVSHLADNLPLYQKNITEKIRFVRGNTEGISFVGRTSGLLRQLSAELEKSVPGSSEYSSPGQRRSGPVPLPVEIREAQPSPLQLIRAIVASLLAPVAAAGIITVFVIVFLLQRDEIRNRFIRLLGARDLQRTTIALDDASGRLSRYFLAQLAVNTAFGTVIGIGLAVIGVPNPILWGLLALILRFVPYVGPILAAVFPAVLALGVDNGWSTLLWTGALFLVADLIVSQLVEPILYGHSTGLSPVAVIVAATFWAWLWGPIGLLMSTPLTLCLVVMGRYVKRLQFLDTILGDQPALSAAERFYHRLLAHDANDIAAQGEEFLRDGTLDGYYDTVAVPALALAQDDADRGLLDHDQREALKSTINEVVEDLADHAKAAPDVKVRPNAPPCVLCIAGGGALDEAASTLLGQVLQRAGVPSTIVPTSDVTAATIEHLDVSSIKLVCISYMHAGGYSGARFLVRRLRRRNPDMKIMLGLWSMKAEAAVYSGAIEEAGVDLLATTLTHAGETIAGICNSTAVPPTAKLTEIAPIPEAALTS